MNKLFFVLMLCVFGLMACEGRHIDQADRARRLSPAGYDKAVEDGLIDENGNRLPAIGQISFVPGAMSDQNFFLNIDLAVFGNEYSFHHYQLIFNLFNGLVFGTTAKEVLPVGEFQCPLKHRPCLQFAYSGNFLQIDKILNFSAIPTNVRNADFTFSYKMFDHHFDLYEIQSSGDLKKIETAAAAQVHFQGPGSLTPSESNTILLTRRNYIAGGMPAIFDFQGTSFVVPFECPSRLPDWVIQSYGFNQQDTKLTISCNYFNSGDFTKSVQKYLIQDAQN